MMNFLELRGIFFAHLILQEGGKERVITEPVLFNIQAAHKQTRALQLLQQLLRILATQHFIAQFAVEPGQWRTVQQKLLHFGRLEFEHIVGQVLGKLARLVRINLDQ